MQRVQVFDRLPGHAFGVPAFAVSPRRRGRLDPSATARVIDYLQAENRVLREQLASATGSSFSTAASVSEIVSPANNFRPVSISNRTQPNAHTSDRSFLVTDPETRVSTQVPYRNVKQLSVMSKAADVAIIVGEIALVLTLLGIYVWLCPHCEI